MSETTISTASSEMGSIEKSDTPPPVVKKKGFPWLIVAIGGVVVLGAAAYLVVKNLSGKNKIVVHYNVTIRGANLKTHYKVLVDNQVKLDEDFVFDVHYSDDYSTRKSFVREFTVEKDGLGQMLIHVEAGPAHDLIWNGESSAITPPIFDLEITSYDLGGKTPVLDKNHFQILASPYQEANRIKEEVVTISAPGSQSTAASQQQKEIEIRIPPQR